ncbi:dihydrolipoyl dehydrogenase family protein [Polymorphobacter sp.]|uniref:dihydrolipoyl dehydrogenase family protein n=1 Tax=Polymorphobacter sp. TaxID=1909290 RepID=UPI003F6ECA75
MAEAPAADRYDLVVIGAGAAGLVTAGGAAQLGAHVLLVEQHRLGGECLWTGCVPSKAMIATAARGGKGWADARAALNAAITTIEPHDSLERFRGFGVEVVQAKACLLGRDRIDVGGRRVSARRIVIATGPDPAVPPIPGLAELPYLTNENLFDLPVQPHHLLVIGGGPIGVELGQAFARLGTAVTIVANGPLLARQDAEAVDVVRRQLVADGLTLHEKATIVRASGAAEDLRLHLDDGREIAGSHILVAAGRKARTKGYGLTEAGVRTGKNGISTDAWLRTSNPRIYAIGDCREGPRLTHAGDQDARAVIQNALFPFRKRKDYSALPAAVYCDPELAQVGQTEADARAQHADISIYRHDFDHNDRSVTDGDARGFVKIVARGKRVLGVTIVGAHAGELLALASFAVSGKLSLADLAAQTFAYPTLAEALRHAAEQPGQAFLFSPLVRRLTRLFQRLP